MSLAQDSSNTGNISDTHGISSRASEATVIGSSCDTNDHGHAMKNRSETYLNTVTFPRLVSKPPSSIIKYIRYAKHGTSRYLTSALVPAYSRAYQQLWQCTPLLKELEHCNNIQFSPTRIHAVKSGHIFRSNMPVPLRRSHFGSKQYSTRCIYLLTCVKQFLIGWIFRVWENDISSDFDMHRSTHLHRQRLPRGHTV